MTVMKLTAASVAGLRPALKSQTYWDTQLPGFACRVSPKGKKVWNVRLPRAEGRPTTVAIGDVGQFSIREAREIAHNRMRQAQDQLTAKGGIKGRYGRVRNAVRLERQMGELTFAEVFHRYLAWLLQKHGVEHAHECAPETWPSDVKQKRITYNALAKAGWADMPLSEITLRDVQAVVDEKAHAGHARAANLLKSHISSLFRWAIREGMIDTNPARDVPKIAYRSKPMALTPEEAKAFLEELEDLEVTRPLHASYMRFMLAAGTRVTEGLELRWQEDGRNNYVDLKSEKVIFKRHKTARITGEMPIALTEEARAVLGNLQRLGLTRSPDGIIFYDPNTRSGHITARSCATHCKTIMGRLQVRFGWSNQHTQEMTLYKLRHSFATEMLRRGASLRDLMHQLKHTNQATTEIYVADHDKDEAFHRVRSLARRAAG